MCYPCSMCNRCGKVDRLMKASQLCPKCGKPRGIEESVCPHCGDKRPSIPKAAGSANGYLHLKKRSDHPICSE